MSWAYDVFLLLAAKEGHRPDEPACSCGWTSDTDTRLWTAAWSRHVYLSVGLRVKQ